MAWIELPGKRTQKAKHFYDETIGKFQAVITIHDQHYKDENNDWQDVDENFEDGGIYDKKCDKARHAIHVGNGGARRWYPRRNVATEYVDITDIQYFDGTWRNLNLPTPVWTNNKTEWNMTHLYASVTNTWRHIKADFILKDALTPTGLRYELDIVGLTYNHTTGELTSIADGLVWGYIQKPTAFDANEVEVPITATWDGTYVTWTINPTGATYPITIDPTFTDGYGGDVSTYWDTFTSSAGKTLNYGTSAFVYSEWDGSANKYNGIIKFALTTLEGTTITSADLYTYKYTEAASGFYGTSTIYPIKVGNSGHTEAGATWNHAVEDTVEWAGGENGCGVSGTDYTATALGTIIHANADVQYSEYISSLDATQFTSLVAANYGVVLIQTAGAWRSVRICSSDDATTGNRPKLVIEYSEGECNVETVTQTVVEWC